MKNSAGLAEVEEFEMNPHLSDILSDRAVPVWQNNRAFVAPSFAEMMLDIKRLEATLQALEDGNDILVPVQSDEHSEISGLPSVWPRGKSMIAVDEFKQTEFFIQAPEAESVQLVADFTHWQKFPLDMVKSEDGTWSIFVPLPGGEYNYAFIVDGKWQNDSQLHSLVVGVAAKFNSPRKCA